ncbi:NAD(P)H-dependent oxidoreductase [Bacillus cereus]|uniref:NAD(P)H-dependent oxidoreductase n=1 Tax=Bacillus cereus TaxID=1396 RepID=UPI0020D27504|nr:NAD(P)H-dependent oxidoreductase [Bacillus cereus]
MIILNRFGNNKWTSTTDHKQFILDLRLKIYLLSKKGHGNDFIQRENKEFLKYAVEQKQATKTNNFSADIQAEQEKLLWADFIIFQFPLWRYSVPGILKGWFDRVFTSGFIYSRDERYDTGKLKGRKVMLSTTTDSPKHAYTPYGMDGDMHEKILYHINHGMLYFSGLEPVEPFIAWTPSHNEEDRKRYLEEYKKRLHNISEIPYIHTILLLIMTKIIN